MSTGLWKDERQQDCNRDMYNSRPSREYYPNLNTPAVQSDEYLTDADWESFHISRSNNQQLFRPFCDKDPAQKPITYEQSKTMSEFFLKTMEDHYQPAEDDQDVAILSIIENTLEVMPASEGHATGMIFEEINQTLDQVMEDRLTDEIELDPFQMQYDPFTIAQSIFDEQMQYMSNPLLMPGHMYQWLCG